VTTPTDPRAADGTVVWTELGVPDLARAQEYYGAVFGWTFAPFGDSFLIASKPDGTMVLGLDQVDGPAAGRHALVYVQVADLEVTLERVTAAGGEVLHGRRLISEEFGWYAVVADPWGLKLGLGTDRPARPTAT
jgi:predicted enzyme related to lactoylglutathione lyase